MALNPEIDEIQTDELEPIDKDLMDAIRLNLERIDDKVVSAAASVFGFTVNGNLDYLNLENDPDGGREVDTGYITQERTISLVSVLLDEQGEGGNLRLNLKKLNFLGKSIRSIESLFSANTQSIVRASAALDTQSIVRASIAQNTQNINYAVASTPVINLLKLDVLKVRVNFADGADLSVYHIGDFIDLAGTSHDGTFEILEIGQDNGLNIIIEDALAITETVTASSQALLVAYEFLGTTPDTFVVGEKALFSGHNDPSNNGAFEIYGINYNANNVVVKKNVSLVSQSTAIGAVNTNRFLYSFLVPLTTAFSLNEAALFSGHTDGNNDGSFEIKALNSLGNDITIYNENGVIQAGTSGLVNTNRFVYALDNDPENEISVNDNATMLGHTDGNNNGIFTIKEIKYLGTNNVVVYNENGVSQAGAAGTVGLSQMAITLYEDASSFLENNISEITIKDTFNELNDGTYTVLEINRESVSTFNIIVDIVGGVEQNFSKGILDSEARSLFTNGFVDMDIITDKALQTFSVLAGDIIDAELENDTILLLDILEAPKDAANMAVNIK